MTNLEKYTEVFTRLFGIDKSAVQGLKYQDIEEWDSVGHMALITELENEFEIDMEADDIIDFESFDKGKEILSNNYNIVF